ncbi:hypothetical protein DLAC_04761 [Tieghemostelium lacteum]|uniref:Uncharacterized protein n=1 Tax=Tieghemostelium lacteum TaxID=361077 RepID=A0A151ZKE0_TIELA|nr:hypothetical protein DLAC_04761 [Tieghemostelium lacteum]|eukprot:KYQ94462.1 hypothetical protein DLAC_04761 [Tieghemostelium lacteum]
MGDLFNKTCDELLLNILKATKSLQKFNKLYRSTHENVESNNEVTNSMDIESLNYSITKLKDDYCNLAENIISSNDGNTHLNTSIDRIKQDTSSEQHTQLMHLKNENISKAEELENLNLTLNRLKSNRLCLILQNRDLFNGFETSNDDSDDIVFEEMEIELKE